MELLTLTVLIFAWYAICALWGIVNPLKIIILVVGFLMVVLSAYVTYYDTLSKPKDTTFEMFRNDDKARVLTYAIDEGVALYVLLGLEGLNEPRYYKFPWSESTEEMAKALVEGEENGEKMVIAKPFEKSFSKERVAHPDPQPKMPDKTPTNSNLVIELNEGL